MLLAFSAKPSNASGRGEAHRSDHHGGLPSIDDEQLEAHPQALFADGTGTMLGAIRNIARDSQATEDFATALVDLLEHIDRNYPIPND
jgi:hypothetical protein